MNLTLKDEEAETLRGLLKDYLPALKFEVARTHAVELRHLLVARQSLCERLLEALGESAVRP